GQNGVGEALLQQTPARVRHGPVVHLVRERVAVGVLGLPGEGLHAFLVEAAGVRGRGGRRGGAGGLRGPAIRAARLVEAQDVHVAAGRDRFLGVLDRRGRRGGLGWR